MQRSALIRITLTAGILAAVGAAGCSLAKEEETGSSPDEVVAAGDVSSLLKSTLVLEGGCIAAKVGPKHLLVSARCVSGNAAFAAGKTLSFTSATGVKSGTATDAGTGSKDAGRDSGTAAKDAGGGSTDAGKDSGTASRDGGAASSTGSSTSRDVTIAEVKIHPSWAAKCKTDLCDFNKIEGSDAPDIALILLENDLLSVPSIPVDLDPVGQGDPLLVVTAGCTSVDGTATAAPKTVRTIAVPAKSVNHEGGPYANAAQLVSRVAASYVVTAGAGWRATAPKLCATDIGAPLFRAGSASIAGVTSNYTTYAEGKLPVTTHHARVDGMSRFKIGDWLSDLGAVTIHSCSETAGGCVKNSYDGGAPGPAQGEGTTQPGNDDGGATGDAEAPETDGGKAETDGGAATEEEPSGPRSETLPSEEPEPDYYGEGEEDYGDAAAPKKKKKKAEGGCSAAPGRPAPSGGLLLGLVIAAGAVLTRRRRAI